MAEFLLKDMVAKRGLEDFFEIASSGTSTEELGSPVHPGTVKKLNSVGVPVAKRRAVQLKKTDMDHYDYFLCMDERNLANALRILGSDPEGKLKLLMSFAGEDRGIADPWYTGDYDLTYEDIYKGLMGLLKALGYGQK